MRRELDQREYRDSHVPVPPRGAGEVVVLPQHRSSKHAPGVLKSYTIWLSTYAQVLYLFIYTYNADEVFSDSDVNLHHMTMARNDTLTIFAAQFMNSSLRFGGVDTKAQFLPIFIGGLPENLRGVLRRKLSDTQNIAYE